MGSGDANDETTPKYGPTSAASLLGQALTPQQVSARYDVATKTLEEWRRKGIGPRYVKPTARMIRYFEADLMAWLARHAVEPRSNAAAE